MNDIGGFLPLEVGSPAGGDAYHDGAAALASGRACWHAILRSARPRRVLLPFYICDAVLAPLGATHTPFTFYALGETFRPSDDVVPRDDELMLIVNYFGAMDSFVGDAARRLGNRVVIDDTQAFFRRGGTGWSFNSVRKFFGVPDGGYAYGPIREMDVSPPRETPDCAYLVARLAGDANAWEMFRAHERRIGIDVRAMSTVSRHVLASVNLRAAAQRRRENFQALHEALQSRNTLGRWIEPAGCEAPLCYPFLPPTSVDRTRLADLGIFIPTFWPELEAREADGFARERDIARRLLPLPIDHRYGSGEMRAVVRALLQELA